RLKWFAALLLPRGKEQALHLRHHRAGDANVRVAPRGLVLPAPRRRGDRAARVHAADVDAPRERDLPIDDRELAVVALVEAPSSLGREWGHRIELEHAHARLAQAIEEFPRRPERAHGIVDQADGDSLRALADQEVGEAAADLVVLDGV